MGTPVNRAPFNALVDDDGSNTIGSPWNKAAIKGVLLDPIDASLAVAGAFPFNLGAPLFVPLPGGTYHSIYPGGATVWMMAGDGPMTWTGIGAPTTAGNLHCVINCAGYPITLSNQDVGSPAANRLIGPGYMNYALTAWRSVWLLYSQAHAAWIVLVP